MSLEHFKNSDEAINQKILICLSNCVRQHPYFLIKQLDDFTDGAALSRIWQASHINLVHRALHIHTVLTKLPTVTNKIVLKFFSARPQH
jgi:hypothetical protein